MNRKLDLILEQMNIGFSDIRAELAEVKSDVAILKVDVANLKEDVANLKEDVANLKEDVAILKVDVANLKQEVNGLKIDVDNLNQEMSGVKLKMENQLWSGIRIIAEGHLDFNRKLDTYVAIAQEDRKYTSEVECLKIRMLELEANSNQKNKN